MAAQTVPGTMSPIKQNYPHRQALVLAAMQVAVGCLCILFQAIAIILKAHAAFVAPGIWCGILFIITGSIGSVSAERRTSGWIVNFMVMSIISAVFTLAVLVTAAIGIDTDRYYFAYECIGTSSMCSNYKFSQKLPKIGMNAVLIGLSVIEAIVAIWSIAICCVGMYCEASTTGTVIYKHAAGGAVPGQVMLFDQNQQMGGAAMYTSPIQTTYVQAPAVVTYQGQSQPAAGQFMKTPLAPQMPQNQYQAAQPRETQLSMTPENQEEEMKNY